MFLEGPGCVVQIVEHPLANPQHQGTVPANQFGESAFVAPRGKLFQQLPGPAQKVVFAPDGRHIATANANGTVYILRLAASAK